MRFVVDTAALKVQILKKRYTTFKFLYLLMQCIVTNKFGITEHITAGSILFK